MERKTLRSMRALIRSCEPYKPTYGFLNTYEYGYVFFSAVKGKNFTMLLNNKFNYNSSMYSAILNDDSEMSVVINSTYNAYRSIILDNNYNRDGELEYHIMSIVTLPPTFLEDYRNYDNTNSSMVDRLSENGWEDDCRKYIYSLTDGSKNLIEWILSCTKNYRVRLSTIAQILQWRDENQNQCKNLSRGSITSYTKLNQLQGLRLEMYNIQKERRANEVASKFNTAQKKLLKAAIGDKKGLDDLLSKFYTLTHTKQMNFIKKVSDINDIDELIRQLRHVTADHFKWSKDDFIDYMSNVEGLDYKIVYDDGPIVIMIVGDFETAKQVARTTNWCISKNRSYWDNYTHNPGTVQYVMFDFSKKEDDNLSIVGFTTGEKVGITNAHDYTNNNMMPTKDSNGEVCHLNRMYVPPTSSIDIYKLLTSAHIDFSLFMKGDALPYAWTPEGVMEYVHKYIDESNITVLKDSEKKLVLCIEDEGIGDMLGKPYMSRVGSGYLNHKHLLFFDFGKSPFISSSMFIAIIEEDSYGCENCFYTDDRSFTSRGFQFERMLYDFGLPYDTIKRPYNKAEMLFRGITNWTYEPSIIKGMSKQDIIDVITGKIGNDTFYRILQKSIMTYHSFDYIDLLYTNGVTIAEVCGQDYARYIIQDLYQKLRSTGVAVYGESCAWPTEEDVEELYDKKVTDGYKASFLVCCLSFETIVNHEINPANVGSSVVFDVLRYIVDAIQHGERNGKIQPILPKLYHIVKNKAFYFSDQKSKKYFAECDRILKRAEAEKTSAS